VSGLYFGLRKGIPMSTHNLECPELLNCPLSAIAVRIIETLARIEEASKAIPQLDKRVDALETIRDEQHGRYRYQRKATVVFTAVVLALLGSGAEVWATLHKDATTLQQNVANLRTQADDASTRADRAERAAASLSQVTVIDGKQIAQLEGENQVIYKTYKVIPPHPKP
jgi:hypothetical protein